jgi:hypothetical protein
MACSVLRCLAVIMHYLLHVCRTPMFQQRELVFSSAPLAPNATRQARPTSGATKERSLLAVACTRLFGPRRYGFTALPSRMAWGNTNWPLCA